MSRQALEDTEGSIDGRHNERAHGRFCFTLLPVPVRIAENAQVYGFCRIQVEPERVVKLGGHELNRATTTTDNPRNPLRAVRAIRPPDFATTSMLNGLAKLHALVMAIDSQRRVIWLSDELGLLNGPATDLIGKPLVTLLRAIRTEDLEVSRPKAAQFIEEMNENGQVSRARFDLSHENDSLRLEVSAFGMRDSANDQLYICFADRDEPREALERKNSELKACVRGVSHDLRSPLVSLLGFSRLLRDDYQEVLDRTGLHFINRIDQAARHIDQLLHDMLEFTRIGATSRCRVHINPKPILEQLHSELKLQLDEKNIDLILPDETPTILFDRTRLYQLFSNLIGNAIHHMDRKSAARIEVEITSEAAGWQISVRDNGPGIGPEDHQRIFGAFETASRPGNKHKSSGLGLAIVKKIVETDSGRVWVESELGTGARFVVWLPSE